MRLDKNQAEVFAMGGEGRTEIDFFTTNPGGKFRSLVLEVPGGEVTVESSQKIITGAYKRTLNGKWYLDSARAKRFVLDTIPQEAGTCNFKLSVNADSPAARVKVELVEYPFSVPKPIMGEKLGALRIKNVPYGLAKIVTSTPYGVVYTEHPEFESGSGFVNGDVTPEGDAFFMMPAGLWQVEVGPSSKDKASSIRACLIPVSSGKETVLDWPLAMTRVFGQEGGSGMEIHSIEPKGDRAEVVFSLQGKEAKNIIPAKESMEIKQGGAAARTLSVRRTDIPLDVVLLLDSSGSMKGQMKKALAATRTFINALPDSAGIRVVDFDTKPRTLKGRTKAEVLRGLTKVRANGATCLNDSILQGLEMLSGSKRPALLVFTDGFDANHNDTGPGSKATKQEVLDAVGRAGIPVFTIGFGQGHDVNTLDRIASLSGGRYYPAADPKALDEAFDIINSNLANTFTATYQRPTKGRPSNVPVVTAVIDISGSMDTTPDKSGCDYRIDRVKAILHDFFADLPEAALGQVMSFNDDVFINQVTTANKGALLSGLNDLYAGGGTNIPGAVFSALETQKAIPSTKRYLVFITDAALEVDGQERVFFETMLAKLKDEGIYCLWVGIGALDEKPFKQAARLSGGGYVLTESIADLKQAFQAMIAEIKKPASRAGQAGVLVEMTLKHRFPSGRNLTFGTAKQALMPAPEPDRSLEIPAGISWSTAKLRQRYSPEVSKVLTGDSVPIREAKISKRFTINVTGRNRAAAFTVSQAFFLNRLRGLDPPSGSRFLAVITSFKNILPKQMVTVYPDGSQHPASWVGNAAATRGKKVEMVPTYVIPDLKRHLFLRWNDKTMTPLSPATWLAEEPLILPGENAVSIPPGEPVKGALVFVVPDEPLSQMSLHFYDTMYGHAQIPLVGRISGQSDRLSSLPAKPPVKLSEAFSLSVREVRDVPAVGRHEAGSGSVFRIVEADFVSNVQALLDINPAERFSLRLNTAKGALNVRLHGVTGLLPLGLLAPTMLSPGSHNRIRLAFRVPDKFSAEAGLGELVVDVKGGGVVIPLDKRAAAAPKLKVPAGALKGDGVALVVNSFKRYGDNEDMYVADLTLFDTRDGQSTAMSDAFIIKKKGFEKAGSGGVTKLPDYGQTKGLAGFATGNAITPVGLMTPDSATDDLMFGITAETIIPDGAGLRGLVVFKLPYGDSEASAWELTSSLFPGLKQAPQTQAYEDQELLVRRSPVSPDYGSSYLEGLEAAVARLKEQREAVGFQRPGRFRPKTLNMDGGASPVRNVPPPQAAEPGLRDFRSIRDLESLKKRLAQVRCLPSKGLGWQHQFAPQAVLTQNWGTEGDLARMAELVLARMGVHTQRAYIELTEEGRQKLAQRAGLGEFGLERLPVLVYRDAQGGKHLLVSPFLEPVTRLQGLVGRILDEEVPADVQKASITVSLLVRPKNAQGTGFRDMSAGLTGQDESDEPERVSLLSVDSTLPELSQGAVDIGYALVGRRSGPVIKAVFDGLSRRVIGQEILDTGDKQVVGERIEISLGDSQQVYTSYLDKGETILDRFHTLGLNLPDLDQAAARTLDGVAARSHGREDAPDNLSALKWYTRHLIYRFITGQTGYENDLAQKLGLILGRLDRPRCLVATVSRSPKGSGLRTSLDLRQTANQIHPGPNGVDDQVAHAFNIMSGLYASRLEAEVLPGNGLGYYAILAALPKDTDLVWLTPDYIYNSQEALKAAGLPPRVMKLLSETSNMVLLPTRPAVINGRTRWAWLEVNPETYQTISVLDTGERGAMVERAFSDLWKDGLDYITGGLVGISSSIWSVSAYSLIMDDYKKIIAEARKFALGLADSFSAKVKAGSFEFSLKPGDTKPSVGYGGPGAGVIGAARKGKSMYDKIKNPKVELGGFDQGFKDGVNYYFSQAG